MAGWADALSKTRSVLRQVFTSDPEAADQPGIDELEESLLQSDVPPQMAMQLVDELAAAPRRKDRRELLRNRLMEQLDRTEAFDWTTLARPSVVLLVGVNGSGKTTTAAKLAQQVMKQGLKPLLCGSDTFRAAGSSQLGVWSEKISCDFVGGEMGADAAGVAFNAVDTALKNESDIVLIDTAGRMHTHAPLMDELPKLCRSVGKCLEGAPHEVWMVLDASLGQNAILQAEQFNKSVPLTGIIVTKLDGSSRAGFLFSVKERLGVPIRYAGLGEGEDDLVPFDAEEFIDALFQESKND